MESARYKFEQKCADCGSSDFVEDHANGDLVCTVWSLCLPRGHRLCVPCTVLTVVIVQSCGLVAESHVIDERSEWRSFGDKVGRRTPLYRHPTAQTSRLREVY